MKSSDRSILIGLAIVGLMAAFWFLLLAPKRERASELEGRIGELQTAVESQEQLAAAGEAAKADFAGNYRSLVSLGKAVPEGSDTSSLFVQLDSLAERSGARLRVIELTQGTGGSAPPETGPAATTVDGAEESAGESEGAPPAEEPATATASATSPAAPTESAAATLPLGATVGTAGLPVMPYSLQLTGDYFQVAKFLDGLDRLVGMRKDKPSVDGRLLTVDGFGLEPDEAASAAGTDELSVSILVTSYVSPADQGLTAGATPSGPAPATTVPSSTTATATPAPTATVAP